MNFIKLYLTSMDRVSTDHRLTPHHVSLYVTLFLFWNLNKFQNPVSICREVAMSISKIGSKNTYVKCLRELHEWRYITYTPSRSPLRGSVIHMHNFDTTSEPTAGPSSGPTTGPSGEHVVVPSINNTNNAKPLNSETTRATPPDLGVDSKGKPMLGEVKDFFAEKKSNALEAEKFFNYFESIGWTVGGKTPIKDWQAAAKNWMLNAVRFMSKPPTRNPHHVTTDKNYSEPL